jgi:hypothetical protein
MHSIYLPAIDCIRKILSHDEHISLSNFKLYIMRELFSDWSSLLDVCLQHLNSDLYWAIADTPHISYQLQYLIFVFPYNFINFIWIMVLIYWILSVYVLKIEAQLKYWPFYHDTISIDCHWESEKTFSKFLIYILWKMQEIKFLLDVSWHLS